MNLLTPITTIDLPTSTSVHDLIWFLDISEMIQDILMTRSRLKRGEFRLYYVVESSPLSMKAGLITDQSELENPTTYLRPPTQIVEFLSPYDSLFRIPWSVSISDYSRVYQRTKITVMGLLALTPGDYVQVNGSDDGVYQVLRTYYLADDNQNTFGGYKSHRCYPPDIFQSYVKIRYLGSSGKVSPRDPVPNILCSMKFVQRLRGRISYVSKETAKTVRVQNTSRVLDAIYCCWKPELRGRFAIQQNVFVYQTKKGPMYATSTGRRHSDGTIVWYETYSIEYRNGTDPSLPSMIETRPLICYRIVPDNIVFSL